MSTSDPRVQRHWDRTKRLTIIDLLIWFFFSYLVHWFADSLNAITFIGFPLGFYMAGQGSLLAFVILIFALAHFQNKIDEEEGMAEDEE